MRKASLHLMQDELALARNKMFTIMGFVQDITIKMDYTRVVVLVTNLLKSKNNDEFFNVYFRGKVKKFVDDHVQKLCVVDIIGHINVSKKSTPAAQILRLEGLHVYVYKNIDNIYTEPNPQFVNPMFIDNDDLAY